MPARVLTDRIGASEKSGALSTSDADPNLLLHLRLTPYQSLSPQGFVTFVGLTFLLMLVPLTALIGTVLWWGLAPFILGALALLWVMLKRSWRDNTVSEDLRLWPDRIEITRHNPRAPDQHWTANPHWVRTHTHPKPVEHYLTLTGGGRDVELGRFLTPAERRALQALLDRALLCAQ